MNNNNMVFEIFKQIVAFLISIITAVGLVIVAIIHVKIAIFQARIELIKKWIDGEPPEERKKLLQKELKALNAQRLNVSRKKKKARTSLLPLSIIFLISGILVAQSFSRPVGIIALISKSTITPTPTLTPTATFTLTLTLTTTPTISCPYQGANDHQTIVNLIQAEALASNTEDLSIIQEIFAPNAVFHDYSPEPSKIWIGPIARYKDDLFLNTDLQNVEHFDILPAGNGIVGDRATYTSGSHVEYKVGDTWESKTNGSSKTTKYGSDHWILAKNDLGCWVIEEFDFNASHVQFP